MNENTEDLLNSIQIVVWSGFSSTADVHEMLDYWLEADADEKYLRAAIETEFQKKAEAEANWPEVTDCDRLDEVFDDLNRQGIIALHNAGFTQSDGIHDASMERDQRSGDEVIGYCFYHSQDVERALEGAGLTLAFGVFEDDEVKVVQIGEQIKRLLEAGNFEIDWDSTPDRRITIKNIDWKRRYTKLEEVVYPSTSPIWYASFLAILLLVLALLIWGASFLIK